MHPVQAQLGDVDELLELRESLALWLLGKGVVQWEHGDMPRPLMEREVADGEVRIVRENGTIIAAVTMLDDDAAFWGAGATPSGYVHRLMVHRGWAGKGVGKQLLAWAEAQFAERGKPCVRLDCLAGDARIRTYYESQGYSLVGERQVTAPRGVLAVALYEKALSPAQ